ncbi:DUF5665 domain-containing protein [Pseudaestuariivita atlantica]|uniref:Uncharacterized protein n=1 Tax=Pseudaestuariivita atlantica TaxID=1317121 RepID=A0A0L1JT19_9RHOB|nr:DUF5665 domain-containing protein [Pseudaestuariivita atlantica]KNG94852.1 hypothetical protein ATO11_05585 [Pseudaestuariivita atlantica]
MTEQTPPPEYDPADVRRLANAAESLLQHRYIRLHDKPAKMLAYQFARGLAFGLGTVLGGGLLVSALVLVLSQVEVIPIIGDWATRLIDEIQTSP